MPTTLQNLELLAVSNDYLILKMFASAVQQLGGRLNSTPSLTSANHFVRNRKIDALIVDLEMRGIHNFLADLRKGSPNRSSTIFACIGFPEQSDSARTAGASFVVSRPLTLDKAVNLLDSAGPTLAAERKRYFRHKLVTPVNIFYDGVQHRALTSNISETGMAIRSFRVFETGAPVEFSFELPAGPGVKGQGEIMWVDAEGNVGIKFTTVNSTGHPSLSEWLDGHAIVHS
ncbi:MAG TPA: PilZ domain-containing protein [Candidatus Angelobacter sp.]|nr:PilZ domain-containing protein [Candidatus Angelobacter sp.]